MKKIFLILGGAAALLIFLFARNKVNKISQQAPMNNTAKGFALIELFTSEGCSSCPPADELINKLSKEKKENVYILSFHVDYWNRLGWKDKFSKAEYSKRQGDYATLLNLNGAYTPQIVVNGKQEFVGSDRTKLYAAINEASTANATTAFIKIKASINNNQLLLNYEASKSEDATINIALVALANSSQVRNGENAGRFLQHTNIVTDFKSLSAAENKNEIKFNIPAGKHFIAIDYKFIAFSQKQTGEIIAVTECNIN